MVELLKGIVLLRSKVTEGMTLLSMSGTPATSSLHPNSLLSLLFPTCHKVSRFLPTKLYCDIMFFQRLKSNMTASPDLRASTTGNENRPFLILFISLEVFCYNNGKLTEKVMCLYLFLVRFLWRTLTNKSCLIGDICQNFTILKVSLVHVVLSS